MMASVIYPHQEEMAVKLVNHFKKGKLVNLLIAPMQWGKTGTVLRTVEILCEKDSRFKLDNVWCITGLSDNEWRTQMKERFPPKIHKNILHTFNLKSQLSKNRLPTIRDGIVIIDEAHLASSKNTMVYQWLKATGCLDLKCLIDRNIRLILTTATPSVLEKDILSWPKQIAAVTRVISDDYPDYRSPMDLNLIQGRKLYYRGLIDRDQVDVLFETIRDYINRHIVSKYHIVRITQKSVMNYISDIAEQYGYDIMYHFGGFNVDFDRQPENDTIVFLKNKLRAAKTVSDEWIGVIHTNCCDDYAIESQGLVGRMCGWNKIGDPTIICNLESLQIWTLSNMEGFDFIVKECDVKSSRFRCKNGKIQRYLSSIMTPSYVKGLVSNDSINDSDIISEKVYGYYNAYDHDDLCRFIYANQLDTYDMTVDYANITLRDIIKNVSRFLRAHSPLRLYKYDDRYVVAYYCENVYLSKKREDIIKGGRYRLSRRQSVIQYRLAWRGERSLGT
jgi:translation initiation factor 2 beta subunit (eIF-2beta)/eIF-5